MPETTESKVDEHSSSSSSSSPASSPTSSSQPGVVYERLCSEQNVAPRPYVLNTLREIGAEMAGKRRSGVISLCGSAKPLFKNRLVDRDVSCFFGALRECFVDGDGAAGFQAVEIDLSSNRIGTDGIATIVEFLTAPGVVVKTLNVSDNSIDEQGAQSVVELLQTGGGQLSSLDVSSNDIGAKGVMNLVTALEDNTALQHLNIGRTGFDSSVMIALFDMLRHRRNRTLNSLGLAVPYVSKRSVPCNTIMEHLGIMLKHNHKITALDLTGHRIDDIGAEVLCSYLCTNGSVQTLLLPKNKVGFKGAAAFAALLVDKRCALVRLNLSQNNIATDGAVSLAKGLVRNITLASLELSNNDIGDEGLLQLQKSATRHRSLKQLRLFRGNHFGLQASNYAHSHPLSDPEEGGVQVDFTSFVVDGDVQIAEVSI